MTRGFCDGPEAKRSSRFVNVPAEWEYVLLSEQTYAQHGRAGFDALLSACRSQLQQLVAFGQGRLF